MRQVLVLVNPHAAAGRAGRLVPAIAEALRDASAELFVSPGIEPALRRMAALPPGSRVIVAGGDGSVQALLPGLLTGELEMALLPCGTGNDTARALGLRGMPWRDALHHALGSPACRIDLGRVETEHTSRSFVSSLCAGFDAAVSERALRAPTWLRGMPRYLWATLGQIAVLRPWHLGVHADGTRVHEGAALFTSTLNTPSYGSGMPAMPAATIDDGRLDLLLAGRFGRLGALAMMPLLLTGLHLRHPRVRALSFRELLIESHEPLPLALDGEPIGAATRIAVQVQPGALAVVRRPPG